MREGCSVALMGLLLDTIPDWGLTLDVSGHYARPDLFRFEKKSIVADE